jgi:hypothetical protein
MICPCCHNNIFYLRQKLIKKDHKNSWAHNCPFCDYTFKETPSRFSQLQRILFIIFIIPFGMFSFVFIMFFSNHNISADWEPIISIVAVVLLVFLAIYIKLKIAKRSDVKTILGNKYEEYDKPKLDENNTGLLNPTNTDPLMKQIEENAIKQVNSQTILKKQIKLKYKYIIIAIPVLILIISIIFSPEFKNIIGYYKKSKESIESIKRELLNNKAEVLMTFLGYYRSSRKPYPPDLSGIEFDDSFAIKLYDDDYKKYFGKVITNKDFIYHSDGASYTLCIDPKIFDRCWQSP